MGGGQSLQIPGGGSEGYHVLKVIDGSPAKEAGMEAFFDYIVSIDGVRLDQENDMLKQILQKYIDQPVKVTVYNSKSRKMRDVRLVPSNTWGGQGLLGVSIRFCSFQGSSENVWHILEVHPNSPAAQAGLIPNTDYVVGSDSMVGGEDDFYSMIELNNHKQTRLYVYNSESDGCREVLLTPNSEWGGEGSLGCGIGFGYLHRIPERETAGQTTPLDNEEKGVGSAGSPPTGEDYADATLSVPSQPGTPGQPAIPLPPSAAQAPSADANAAVGGGGGGGGDDASSLENGVEALAISVPPKVPDSFTPAPVTVVRTPQRPNAEQISLPSATPQNSLPGMPTQQMTPMAMSQVPLGPARGAEAAAGNPVSLPSQPGISFAGSGLPSAPPTISLPTVAPTISLGPTPNLVPATST